MYKLKIGNIKLPDLMVCKDSCEATQCKEKGIPYIRWNNSEEELIKIVLYPTLRKMFPSILWDRILGLPKQKLHKEIVVKIPKEEVDIHNETTTDSIDETSFAESGEDNFTGYAENYRGFDNGFEITQSEMKLGEYIGSDFQVNIEELQELHMLPEFLNDIATNIKKNLYGLDWYEGYNKRLKQCVGNFNAGATLDNLIILDVSSSIPRGISDTMLALIDTMRHQANADLIVTGATSYFWKADEELPSAYELRRMVPPSNEAKMFNKILREKIAGRKFGHVIVFGDNDCPKNYIHYHSEKEGNIKANEMSGTEVKELWSYHTSYKKTAGYGLWVEEFCPNVKKHYNTNGAM